MIDSIRLAVGTFTAMPVTPPAAPIDTAMGRRALLLAPWAVLPLGLLGGLILLVGDLIGLAPVVAAILAVAAVILGNRAFHLDGLADTVDGLAVFGDPERSMRVIKAGDIGPAGAGAVVLTLALQVAGTTAMAGADWGPLLFVVAVAASRTMSAIGCIRPVPPARGEGMGATLASSVPVPSAAASWLLWSGAFVAAGMLADFDWWRPLVGVLAALAAAIWLLRRVTRRFGGVFGDALGALVEIAFALLLVALV